MEEKELDYLEQLDAWIDGEDEGSVPLALLQQRGIALPPAGDLDDAALTEKLWEVLRGMAGIGMYVDTTDHLSDRQLYDKLESQYLREPTFVSPDNPAAAWHLPLLDSGTDEENELYMRYHASEDYRSSWLEQFPGDILPPREKAPFDRDRFLPTHEARLAMLDRDN